MLTKILYVKGHPNVGDYVMAEGRPWRVVNIVAQSERGGATAAATVEAIPAIYAPRQSHQLTGTTHDS